MRLSRSLELVFVGMVLIVVLGSVRLLQGDFHLTSNLLDLLPEEDGAAASRLASQQLSSYLGDDFVFFIKGADAQRTAAATNSAAAIVAASDYFELISPRSQFEARMVYIDMLKQHRFYLLTQEEAELASSDGAGLLNRAIQAAYDFTANGVIATLAEDPLGLFNRYVLSQSGSSLEGDLIDGVVLLNATNASYGVLHGRAKEGAFNLDVQAEMTSLENDLGALVADQNGSIQLLRAGMIFHASRAANSAKQEVTLIGLGSVVGILVLFLASFRSVWPLMLSLSSIAFGCIFALVLCWNFYGSLHLLTLVFGASLVGVTVDYSLHYLTREHKTNAGVPGLGLALLTSIVGYGALLETHLPGLREMAVFSIAGLIASGIFVMVVFPRIKFPPRKMCARPLLLLSRVPSALARRINIKLAWGIVVAGIAILTQITLTSDIRVFHTPDPVLLDEQAQIESLAPGHAANQFFLIRGDTAESVLLTAEAFQPELERLVAQGAIGGYSLISDALPSQQRQNQNNQLLMDTVYSPGGEADTFFTQLNFSDEVRHDFRASLAAAQPLTPAKWFVKAPQEQTLMWLGQHAAAYYSIVLLAAVQDIVALEQVAQSQNDIEFIDTVAAISSTLEASALAAGKLLAVAYLAIAAVLLLRYRHLSSLKLLLIPLVSSIVTVAALTLLGVSLTLFHLFALYLILGLGMDYGIFMSESLADSQSCQLAILLSVLTSSLSFGLLALSSTPMIASFGLTIMLGGLCNWLLVPLVVQGRQQQIEVLT